MIDEETTRELAQEISLYIRSRQDKNEDEFLKAKPKKNKQGVVTNGAINNRLISILAPASSIASDVKVIEKLKKNKEQTSLAFQRDKYQALLTLCGDVIDEQVAELKQEYQNFSIINNAEHDVVTWLKKWCVKATDISFATHVGKLTHSSSKSSSILDMTEETNDRYLTTNSLSDIEVDTASSNAASLPIADVLKLSVKGISVLDCIKNNDPSIFKAFTTDNELIKLWCEQLRQAYDSRKKQSYFLSKQTYFPTAGEKYHLLLPLTSSSLVHAIHLEHKKYFDDTERLEARKQKDEGKYSTFEHIRYPNKAYIHVTGSNHSNASSLNGKRGGRIALMSTMPPQWRSQPTSYKNRTSIFDKNLAFELQQPINDLRHYLLLIKSKELSISSPKRNAAVRTKLEAISDFFFEYLSLINLNESDGWTIESELPIEQQLVFEPWREDEKAKSLKVNKQWQKKLSQDYGRWLNRQLNKNKKLMATNIHADLWADIFSRKLREMVAIQEVTI